MKNLFVVTLLILCALTCKAQERRVHNLDIASVISRVTTPGEYGLNKQYLDLISSPAMYLGDFYGVQILNNVPLQDMKKELDLRQITDSTAVVKLKSGVAILYYNTDLDILGFRFPNNHIKFEGDTFKEFVAVKNDFYQLLKDKRILKKYLIKNKFYSQELMVKRMSKNKKKAVLNPFSIESFEKAKNAILIYPDKVHGDSKAFEDFLQFVESANFDWLGIEMLNSDMQKLANNYIFAKEDSKEFKDARDAIEAFYSVSWINHFKDKPKTINNNPFIRLFKLMRERNIAIYGIEGSNAEFLFFRNGETPFGGAVRNVCWAEKTPTKGRGIIFGGSAHFNNPNPVNYQDVIMLYNSKITLYTK